MELVEGKEYWVKARFLRDDNYHFKPLLFEFGEVVDGTSWIARDIEAVEAIPVREKEVIPKFVADWIEYCKKEKFWALHGAYINMSEQLKNWRFKGNNSEIFARAWLDGYEIEKEPLYWVRDKEGRSLLTKKPKGIEVSNGLSVDFQKFNAESYTFTEKEIKDYDERYWAFVVPVEEEE